MSVPGAAARLDGGRGEEGRTGGGGAGVAARGRATPTGAIPGAPPGGGAVARGAGGTARGTGMDGRAGMFAAGAGPRDERSVAPPGAPMGRSWPGGLESSASGVGAIERLSSRASSGTFPPAKAASAAASSSCSSGIVIALCANGVRVCNVLIGPSRSFFINAYSEQSRRSH